jgi:hypothetical protein
MSSTQLIDPLQQLETFLGPSTDIPRPPNWFSTREERIQARILARVGFKYAEGADTLKLIIRQVGYAIRNGATPRRRTGRPPILTINQIDELIEFVIASKPNRRMAFWRLAHELGWEGVSASAIRSALARAGYKVFKKYTSLP